MGNDEEENEGEIIVVSRSSEEWGRRICVGGVVVSKSSEEWVRRRCVGGMETMEQWGLLGDLIKRCKDEIVYVLVEDRRCMDVDGLFRARCSNAYHWNFVLFSFSESSTQPFGVLYTRRGSRRCLMIYWFCLCPTWSCWQWFWCWQTMKKKKNVCLMGALVVRQLCRT